MKDLELSLKSTVLTLRWLTVLMVILLMIYSHQGFSFSSGAYLLAVNFILTNILLAFIPPQKFERPITGSFIMVMDVAFVSLAIYLTSGFNTDFYLVYFMVIFVAAMRQELKGSILAGAVATVLYGWLVYKSTPNFHPLNGPFLIRGVFFLLVAAMSGILAHRARANEDAKKVAADLAISKAELERWNLQLEMKVRERTQELVRTQEKLLRSERLATIGQLAASVGHELRNPLGILQNALYLLNSRLKGADEKVAKYLATMEKELARSDAIVSELLEFSRDRTPALAPINLNEIIEAVLSKVVIPDNVELSKTLSAVPVIRGDSNQLQSIFLNLISNGVQAMPEGGTLTIKTYRDDGFVEAEVSDTGVGITEGDMSQIFEPLFTTKPKGIGLGLAIAKNMIEKHGGTIAAESHSGSGATFRIRLPLGPDQKAESSCKAETLKEPAHSS